MMTRHAASNLVIAAFGQGAQALLRSAFCLARCPECDATISDLYGWYPLVRLCVIAEESYIVLKEQCFGCGYHKAMWLGLDLSADDREGLAAYMIAIAPVLEGRVVL